MNEKEIKHWMICFPGERWVFYGGSPQKESDIPQSWKKYKLSEAPSSLINSMYCFDTFDELSTDYWNQHG